MRRFAQHLERKAILYVRQSSPYQVIHNLESQKLQPGAARNGQALLAGLLRCRRCGRKLTVRYTGSGHDVLRYCCMRGFLDNGEPRCIAFGGITVAAAVAREVLRVVQPAAIEASMLAHTERARQRDDVLEALERDRQAAAYAADRARR